MSILAKSYLIKGIVGDEDLADIQMTQVPKAYHTAIKEQKARNIELYEEIL